MVEDYRDDTTYGQWLAAQHAKGVVPNDLDYLADMAFGPMDGGEEAEMEEHIKTCWIDGVVDK